MRFTADGKKLVLLAWPQNPLYDLRKLSFSFWEAQTIRFLEWGADLSSEKFATRDQATSRHKKLGRLAATQVAAAAQDAAAAGSEASHRALLNEWSEIGPPTREEIRQIRGVTVLERIASPAACRHLEELAARAREARLTQEARDALARPR